MEELENISYILCQRLPLTSGNDSWDLVIPNSTLSSALPKRGPLQNRPAVVSRETLCLVNYLPYNFSYISRRQLPVSQPADGSGKTLVPRLPKPWKSGP